MMNFLLSFKLWLWLLLCGAIAMQGCKAISYGSFPYNVNEQKHLVNLGEDNLVWDTGSSGSLFFSSPRSHKLCVGYEVSSDCMNTRRLHLVWFSRRISAGDITVKNVRYIIPRKGVPNSIANSKGGIVGMNVINRAVWLVDFAEKTIQIIPHSSPAPIEQSPALCLPYRRPRVPKTSLVVEGVEVKNVLMDTGASGDLYLPKAVLEQLHRNIRPIDSTEVVATCLYTDSIRRKAYRYSNVTVNGCLFSTLTIYQSKSTVMGMGFFQRFDQLYLDTKKRELQLYR